jgi:hypothetical protein
MRLVAAARRQFAGSAAFLDDPGHREFVGEYLADMVRPHGLALDAALSGHSYGEMAEALLRETVAAGGPAVDLLVVAYANHDVYPGRALATHLSRRCPGTPLSFAVCDQGPASAFTALQILHASRPSRALLLVLEQSELPYPCDAALPARHRGVALLFAGGEPAIRVRQYADVAAADIPQLLKSDEPLILGEALAAAWPQHPEDAELAPPQQPMTGVWWPLAGRADHSGRLVVADYDPALRYLSSAEM